MRLEEKVEAIQFVINNPNSGEVYYKLLEDINALKTNYLDYMTTEPIDCDVELKRLSDADFDLCAALLTMLLREEHFSNGLLMERYKNGQIDAILNKMLETLKN